MTGRIFRSIIAVALAIMAACLMVIMSMLYSYFSQVQLQQLNNETRLAAQAVQNEGLDYFRDLDAGNCRITWIDSDGTVLYDSETDAAAMENHLDRAEVQQALQYGVGQGERYSETLTRRYFYCARLLPGGTVLRLSESQNTLLTLALGMGQSVVMVVTIALVLSMFLANRLAKRIVQPLNEVNLDDPLSNEGYEELAPLLRRIDSQQRQLRQQTEVLRRKQNEFDAVAGSMNEGLVLMNVHAQILSMNPAAAELFDAPWYCKGDDFLTVNRTPEVRSMVDTALSGKVAEGVVELHGRSYQMDANPVLSDGAVSGAVLFLFDVTDKQRSEMIRREFTANVSHELKTPLQSISGYAELMAKGIVRPEDMMGFADKIYTEAQRLIQLVEDVIHLSRLDEGGGSMERSELELYGIASETVAKLSYAAEVAQVEVSLEGETCPMVGIWQLVAGIVFNLCDNAIKYNRPGGWVRVTVENRPEEAVLTVADNGIGIPREHQDRIFERFYRVDKSHSKEVGGTGLGLSIVKHAVMIHNGKIDLDSAPGRGTTITVHFPKG